MFRLFRLLIVTAVFAAVTLSAAFAVAAPITWESVDVTVHSEKDGGILLVSGQLPKTVSLPAEAELSVPAGSSIQWIGQILGGEPSADPELQYTKTSVNGLDVYRFTLTKSRTAQIEVPIQAGQTFDGSIYTSALTWTSTQDIPVVRMIVRVPAGAQVETATPGAAMQPGDSGFGYYTKTFNKVKAGETLDLSMSYSLPTVAAAAAAQGAASRSASGSSLVPIVIIAVFIGAFGLLIFKVRQKNSARFAEMEEPGAEAFQEDATEPPPARTPQAVQEQPAEEEPQPRRKIKPVIPILAVVGLLVVGTLIAGNKGTAAKLVDNTITRSFGGVSPCTSASIPIVANQGVDLASQGEKVLDAFTGQQGVGDVTLDVARSKIDIAFCDSSQTEESIRGLLTGTGLVTAGAAVVESAPATTGLDPVGE